MHLLQLNALRSTLGSALSFAAKQVQAVLGGGMTAWMSHSSASQHPMPSPHHFIVFISGNEAEMEEAANAAAACAFEHVAVLQGSLSHFDEAVNAQVCVTSAAQACCA